MNMQNNLEKVRAAVIAAVPEIMELTFGCYVDVRGLPRTAVVIADMGNANIKLQYIDNGQIRDIMFGEMQLKQKEKILGRPIRLSDVLRTIVNLPDYKHPGHNLIGVDGSFWKWDNADRPPEWTGAHKWNLTKDDLNLQSQETLQFLSNLLTT